MRPEKVFENITDLMRFSSDITGVVEVGTTTTVSTSDLKGLKDGMLVEIGTNTYQVSNITTVALGNYTFDIPATGITDVTWQLALYYEYGRALEVGQTLEDKSENTSYKNRRFPMFWLLTDIEKDESQEGWDYSAPITFGLIYLSHENFKAKKRIESNFEPILDLYLDLFKQTIKKSPGSRYFVLPFGEKYDIKLADKFKYGSISGDRNIFNEITDAIELNCNFNFSREIDNNCN